MKDGEALQFLPVQCEQRVFVPSLPMQAVFTPALLLIELFGNPSVDKPLMLTVFHLALLALAWLSLSALKG